MRKYEKIISKHLVNRNRLELEKLAVHFLVGIRIADKKFRAKENERLLNLCHIALDFVK